MNGAIPRIDAPFQIGQTPLGRPAGQGPETHTEHAIQIVRDALPGTISFVLRGNPEVSRLVSTLESMRSVANSRWGLTIVGTPETNATLGVSTALSMLQGNPRPFLEWCAADLCGSAIQSVLYADPALVRALNSLCDGLETSASVADLAARGLVVVISLTEAAVRSALASRPSTPDQPEGALPC